ncbi:urease accessory protein UreF [Devosia rhodophyticola]|uniref:Urease accessory protein UreF n=1 Tax=Devosia rhodophyticola TaxID=3026423 RepID=A0ABY7YVM2_9HYPH|nr:urease accessory protein UreF [Devosia rhodophyticola]WDR05296.1 urease accessory protein UreF [Devosia rhodophyticola]
MSETTDLQKLLTWLSPAFPIGAFAWSAGLETAIATNDVHDLKSTGNWIEGVLRHGSINSDAILLNHARQAFDDKTQLQELADLCLALTPARERHEETLALGSAFALAAKAWPTNVPLPLLQQCPYPISFGALVGAHGIAASSAIAAFLTAAVHAQISVAVRLVPIGQTDGLSILAALEPIIAERTQKILTADLADIVSIAYAADIAQMRHETLSTRIFRS